MLKLMNAAPLSAVLLLAGCVTASGIKEVSRDFTAVSGERTRLHDALHLNRDCSPDTLPNVRVMTPPQHGKIDLVTQDVSPVFKGPSTKCNGTKLRGVSIYYASKTGYVGQDKVIIRESYGDGKVVDATTKLNVVQ